MHQLQLAVVDKKINGVKKVMKKRISFLTAVLTASMLAGCGAVPVTETEPEAEKSDLRELLEETTSDKASSDDTTSKEELTAPVRNEETSNAYDIMVKTARPFEGYEETGTRTAEEKTDNAYAMAREEGEGDFAKYMDGYAESSLNGKLSLYRRKSGDEKFIYEIQEGGETVITTPEFDNSIYSYHYFQVADMDRDGTEEILVADYIPTTAIMAVGQFYVYKKSGETWDLFAGNSCDGQGNIETLLEGRSEYQDARIDDVELMEDGLRVITDKGTKIDAVFYGEEYELMITERQEGESDAPESESAMTPRTFFAECMGTYSYEGCTLDGSDGILVIEEGDYSFIEFSDYIGGDDWNYRFEANDSNCKEIRGNKAYVEYPEMVYADDTAIFSYYIFEKTDEGINVYFSKNSFDEAELIYSAVK